MLKIEEETGQVCFEVEWYIHVEDVEVEVVGFCQIGDRCRADPPDANADQTGGFDPSV